MTGIFTLAHLSDVHLGPLPRLALAHLNLKRSLGFLNWHKHRKHVHLKATLDQLTADLASQNVDHIAVTGDLANIGLPEEYAAALRWLQSLGPPERVSVVPGNHDIYTRLRNDPGHRHWRAYMMGAAETARRVSPIAASDDIAFPYVRRLGRIAIIGTNSAVETRPFYAGGRLGDAQRERLARHLEELGREGLFPIVLIHHPPLPGQAKPTKALADAAALEELLFRHGAGLVLHGHNHVSMLESRPTSSAGTLWSVGVPSASLGRHHKTEHLARYHLLHIRSEGSSFDVELVARGFADPGGPIVELDRRRLDVKAHAVADTHEAGSTRT